MPGYAVMCIVAEIAGVLLAALGLLAIVGIVWATSRLDRALAGDFDLYRPPAG